MQRLSGPKITVHLSKRFATKILRILIPEYGQSNAFLIKKVREFPKNNEQKCPVLAWVPQQTFQAWPFISGVTSTGKSHWKVCIRHAYMTMSEVIVLISIASDIAPQKGIWQEYYWNLLFDTLSPLTNISQAQYNKCGWWSFILLAKSLVLPLVEAVAWFPERKNSSL